MHKLAILLLGFVVVFRGSDGAKLKKFELPGKLKKVLVWFWWLSYC